jgi:hypothetical protein
MFGEIRTVWCIASPELVEHNFQQEGAVDRLIVTDQLCMTETWNCVRINHGAYPIISSVI